MGGKKPFICQNPACKTTFSTPLKTLNLKETPAELYYACPNCLIKIEDSSLEIQENPKEKPAPKPSATEPQTKQNVAENSGNPQSCRFHLGYLSRRAPKEQIPDDCLVCRNIVECMLNKMQEEQKVV